MGISSVAKTFEALLKSENNADRRKKKSEVEKIYL